MKKLLLLASCALMSMAAFAQTLANGFGITNVTDIGAWVRPAGALFSKDGQRLFVWEQAGLVYVCNRQPSGNYNRQSTPVLNISDEVGGWRDFGLLGFAIDPNFESNGYIYAYYVVDRHHLMTGGLASNGYSAATNEYFNATIGRVTRYTTSSSGNTLTAVASSRKILLGESRSTGIPILHESHGTGGLVFAADGTLLLSSGDGASYNTADGGSISHTYYQQAITDGIIRPEENVGAFRSQMLSSHNGKLLRLNPENGDGVSSNPFYDAAAPRSARSRVWALGLRNPFRISVKPGTGSTNPTTGDIGEILVGDVGWSTWEELNVVKAAGTNFGWPLYEGLTSQSDYMALNRQNPDEPNTFGSCAGRPNYMFEELIRQDNAAKDKSVYNPCNSSQLIGTHNRFIHARPAIAWHHGTTPEARVGRFSSSGAATNPMIGTAESEVIGSPFNGNCSVGGVWYTGAGNSFPAAYRNTFIVGDYANNWIRRLTMDFTDVVTRVDNFGSGLGSVVCLTENPLDGSIVCVNIGSGANNGTVRKIVFGGNIPPTAIIKSDKYYSASNTMTINFNGSSSFDQNGSIASYAWNFGGGNPATGNTANPANISFTGSGVPRKFVVKLTVTDNGGASHTDSMIVSVNNTPPQVNIISPEKNSKYRIAPDSVYMRTAVVNDNEQSGSQLTYAWQTTLVHNTHVHPESLDNEIQSPTMISRIGCNGDDYSWLITLNVTDAAGLSTVDSSRIFPDCAGTLPVFLHKFSVTQTANVNQVKWTTELESNMEYFDLERSTDGSDFTPINRQPATNMQGPNLYSYADHSFLPGTNYYRLKMVEAGNIIKYSIIIKTITEAEKNVLRIAPNPVKDNFSLLYYSSQEETISLQLKDVTGRVLKTFREAVNKGQNLVHIPSLPDWSPGVYFLSVQNKNETRQVRFIKE